MKKYMAVYAAILINMFVLPMLIVILSKTGIPVYEGEVKKPEDYRVKTIKTYIKSEDKVIETDLEEYLCGVIAAEMPASFPIEALKAQAVAARSYIINKISKNSATLPEHKGADVCTDSAHCKAWMPKEERLEKWAESERENNWNKITAAVRETSGEIMLYNSEPVSAVFYAISAGKTERAVDVWGSDVPYLQSEQSPYDVNAPGYLSAVTLSKEEFKSKLLAEFSQMKFSNNPNDWYKNEIRSEGGAVVSSEIGGIEVKGTKLRSIFGLRSHNFTVDMGENIVFNVKGYGHGVGMSQWGAKFYAEEGKNYRDILRTYYKGVEFSNISDNSENSE